MSVASAPIIGEPLPRAAEAYTVPEKLAWILAEGHGREWARVLRVDEDDAWRFWSAITLAVLDAPIYKVTDRKPYGMVCGVKTILAVGKRTANARTFWHYKHAHDAPRLVTAYPTL
ncbi:MAG TPA: hypothetical protein VGH60_10045 [Solirubrobacteraceae bacterium]|jgi:hypothetical protein